MCVSDPDARTVCANHARAAVQDWLETQSRITCYWRDVLVSSGENEDLIAVLDHHAAVLRAAAASQPVQTAPIQ